VSSATGKLARRNMAKQARQQKQEKVLSARRAASDADAPPRVLVVVAAGEAADAEGVVSQILSHAGDSDVMGGCAELASGATVVYNRQRFTVVRPTRRVEAVLDAMKAGDVMVLAIPADGGLDVVGEQIVDAVCMQGVGCVVGVLTGVEALHEKQQAAARKEWAASLHARFPDHSKFFCLDQDPQCAALLRHLSGISLKKLLWREQRSYVLCESHTYQHGPVDPEGGEAQGTLTVEGYVRGLALCSGRMVHVPGVGDFTVERAVVLPDRAREGGSRGALSKMDPSMDASMDASRDVSMDVDEAPGLGSGRVLAARAGMDAVYEAEGDALAGEQTWPTEAELADASIRFGNKKDGDYQRIWTGALEVEEEEEEKEEMGEAGGDAFPISEEADEEDDGMDADVSEIDETAARRAYLQQRAARDEDARFPDEVNTPVDVPAKSRFARYRGLTSLKSSPWHPRENLPTAYARVYHFEHWPTLQRQALRDQAAQEPDDATAPAGAYVQLVLRVPAHFAELYGASGRLGGNAELDAPLILSSLNTHENRLAVVHFTFTLTAAAEAAQLVLRGKAPLVLHAGFRRFAAQPIYSEDNRRSTKHKLERFVQPGRQVVATVYAPATYGPCPLLAFLPGGEAVQAAPSLAGLPVASGALLSVDADRIILKRITLTGAPVRCHKKKAVVRWMFFSPEDVRWFKPVELHTKFGRKGHIREPLGTHGYMKCYFDGTMMQHDTVCMSLYKRAFPKWTGPFSYRL
jgi:pre-rRNA-processing protein TSR1